MKTVKVKPGQNLMDIALQETGSLDGMVEIALSNDLSLTSELKSDRELKITPAKSDEHALRYYAQYRVTPATEFSLMDFKDELEEEGIGFMVIGTTFKVYELKQKDG